MMIQNLIKKIVKLEGKKINPVLKWILFSTKEVLASDMEFL